MFFIKFTDVNGVECHVNPLHISFSMKHRAVQALRLG
jgi:hypothetical protein